MDDDHNNRDHRLGAIPPRHATRPVRNDDRRGWIGWLIGAALALLILFLLIRGCEEVDEQSSIDPNAATAADTGARVSDAGDPMTGAATSYATADFDAYLSGSEPTGRAFVLDRVTFASGSDALDARARAEIAELAGVLKRYPNAVVALTGYADPEGAAAANQALSRRRAEAVRNALTEAGATAGSVTLGAHGETGAAAVRENRKVEVRVTTR